MDDAGIGCHFALARGLALQPAGWAQINGLGETDTDDKMAMRVQFDLHAIQNWSFWMDLKTIAWTGLMGRTGNNAY